MDPCGLSWRGNSCDEVGDHFCVIAADKAEWFFRNALVHTKGLYAGRKFMLRDWQRDDIVRPLFGETVFSVERNAYVRRYRVAWIELGRKNGKSELLAGIMLCILFTDGEMSAELFGVAKDREQASAIFNVAAQMIAMNPTLKKMAEPKMTAKRIVKPNTNSFYRVIANDAASALGSNPSAIAADEILAWPHAEMWDALRTGMVSLARKQPLLVAATTAGYDTESFGGQMHKQMQKIADDPTTAPNTFVYMRNLPMEADPWDEDNWFIPNPALGDFLSLEEMRELAREARQNPAKEVAFRQFHLNQWQKGAVRWMPMHLFDASKGVAHRNAEATLEAFAGRDCWFGIDLAARQDLTAVCYLFPDGDDACDVVWRFWAPESAVEKLDKENSDRFSNDFVRGGWLTVTEGDVLDFQRVYADIESDSRRFNLLGGDADKWSSDPVIQEIESRTYVSDIFAYTNDFSHMSDGMHRIFEMVRQKSFRWHDNPLARFCFDSCEARIAKYDPDLVRPDKPNRQTAAKRIDAVPAAIMAVNAWKGRGGSTTSYYADNDVMTL